MIRIALALNRSMHSTIMPRFRNLVRMGAFCVYKSTSFYLENVKSLEKLGISMNCHVLLKVLMLFELAW